MPKLMHLRYGLGALVLGYGLKCKEDDLVYPGTFRNKLVYWLVQTIFRVNPIAIMKVAEEHAGMDTTFIELLDATENIRKW